MWLRFADARVERAWRAYHAASHTSTDLLWCALLLLVWLVAIGKRFFTHGPMPLLLAGGPALLLLAVRQSLGSVPCHAAYACRFSVHGMGVTDRASPSARSIAPLSTLAPRRCSRCSSTGSGTSSSACRCCALCALHRQGPSLPHTALSQGRAAPCEFCIVPAQVACTHMQVLFAILGDTLFVFAEPAETMPAFLSKTVRRAASIHWLATRRT